jgi:hypothetical protein
MGMHAYTYIPFDSVCVDKSQMSRPMSVNDLLNGPSGVSCIHALFRRVKFAHDAAMSLDNQLNKDMYKVERVGRYVIVSKRHQL